ncbi:MAG: M28 family peptidase [Bacteroidota bacterium]
MLKYFFLTAALISGTLYIPGLHAQTFDPFYQTVVSNISYDSVLANLQQFEALGVKEPGTNALNNTRDWILDKYINSGYTDIQVDSFNAWGDDYYNIIISKTGTLYPDTFVIIDGHYDTNNGTGTNDNGSGTSIILEVARVLKDIYTEYSIKFIHFSGEEMGYLGSDHYVNDIVNPQNMNIRIVFNIDEVGGVAGLPNDTVKCESDQSNPSSNDAISDAFTDTLMTLTEIYSSLKTIMTNAYGSDYVPFQQNGEIITGYYEYNKSDYVHTSDDFLLYLDTSYVYEIAKASAASTMYFARAYDVSVDNAEYNKQPNIIMYPNPFSNQVHISSGINIKLQFTLYNLTGQKIIERYFSGQTVLYLSELPASGYLFRITDSSGNMMKSGLLVKEK